MRFIRDYILKDLRLKVLSLVLAAMLWIAISYIGESKMTVSVPVGLKYLGNHLMIEKIENDAVLVTIGGPISILKNLRAHDIRVVLNVSGAKRGSQVFTLARDNIVVPKGVKVEEIKPDYVAVEIDKAVEKRLKVVVKLDEKWAETYWITSWYPQYVNVVGGEETLKNRHSIETVPVNGDLKGAEEEADVPLAVKGISLKKISPETIRVHLRRK